MKLRDLNARFVICVAVTSSEQDAEGKFIWRDKDGHIWLWSPTPVRHEYNNVETVAEAHGVRFDCPKCHSASGHGVLVGFEGRNPPEPLSRGANGQPTQWHVSGTGLDDLVLSPSIQLLGGCNWHGFVGMSGVPPGEAA